jgi:hypothetical protein
MGATARDAGRRRPRGPPAPANGRGAASARLEDAPAPMPAARAGRGRGDGPLPGARGPFSAMFGPPPNPKRLPRKCHLVLLHCSLPPTAFPPMLGALGIASLLAARSAVGAARATWRPCGPPRRGDGVFERGAAPGRGPLVRAPRRSLAAAGALCPGLRGFFGDLRGESRPLQRPSRCCATALARALHGTMPIRSRPTPSLHHHQTPTNGRSARGAPASPWPCAPAPRPDPAPCDVGGLPTRSPRPTEAQVFNRSLMLV